jgi:hypothetical protein
MFSFISEHSLGLALQLPDTLARDAEFLAESGERRRILTVEAVTADEDATLALRESLDGLQEAVRLELPHHLAGYSGLPLVLYEITEFRAILL